MIKIFKKIDEIIKDIIQTSNEIIAIIFLIIGSVLIIFAGFNVEKDLLYSQNLLFIGFALIGSYIGILKYTDNLNAVRKHTKRFFEIIATFLVYFLLLLPFYILISIISPELNIMQNLYWWTFILLGTLILSVWYVFVRDKKSISWDDLIEEE